MTHITFYDEAEALPRVDRGPRTWFRPRWMHRPPVIADLGHPGATRPSHVDRWADLYVRHGL